MLSVIVVMLSVVVVMLSVIMLNVIMMNVTMLIVFMLSILINDMLLSVVMLIVVTINVIMVSVILMNVIIQVSFCKVWRLLFIFRPRVLKLNVVMPNVIASLCIMYAQLNDFTTARRVNTNKFYILKNLFFQL